LEKLKKDFILSMKIENFLKKEDLEDDLKKRLMMRKVIKKKLLVIKLNISQIKMRKS